MTTYVALLRGIGPTNPNMHPAKLKGAFEKMGFRHVRTVIASGNVVFESSAKNEAGIERKIEKALPTLLGFSSTTIVRSADELDQLFQEAPFGDDADDPELYPLVTFLKHKPVRGRGGLKKDDGYIIYAAHARFLCIAPIKKKLRTVDLMSILEKHYGKEITSRTWKSVGRILKKMRDK